MRQRAGIELRNLDIPYRPPWFQRRATGRRPPPVPAGPPVTAATPAAGRQRPPPPSLPLPSPASRQPPAASRQPPGGGASAAGQRCQKPRSIYRRFPTRVNIHYSNHHQEHFRLGQQRSAPSRLSIQRRGAQHHIHQYSIPQKERIVKLFFRFFSRSQETEREKEEREKTQTPISLTINQPQLVPHERPF